MDSRTERKANAERVERAISQLESDHSLPSLLDDLSEFAAATIGMGSPKAYPDFKKFWIDVREINQLLNALPLDGCDRASLRASLDRLCERMKTAQADKDERQRRVLDENRDQISQAIRMLRFRHGLDESRPGGSRLKGFWTEQKAVVELFRELKPLRKDDRESLWQKLEELCNEVRRLQQEISLERDEKNQAWRARMQEHLVDWRAMIERKSKLVISVIEEIERLVDQRDSARTSEFADTVKGWIQDKQSFQSSLEQEIKDLTKKVHDVEQKLEQDRAR